MLCLSGTVKAGFLSHTTLSAVIKVHLILILLYNVFTAVAKTDVCIGDICF